MTDALADRACDSLTRKARALAREYGSQDPQVVLFLDVAAAIQRERARIAAGEPVERRKGPDRPTPEPEPMPPPVYDEPDLNITPRELDVIRGLSAGLSIGEVATELVVSTNTVKTLQRRAADRLGVRNHAGALVHTAHARGLLNNDSAPQP